ncbi:hypothetical protein [Ligilactobacillus pobuzihii]|uniref:Uncharacterized protein n=1 Tax=Ligilactobacillus pobuzihii TaxID=449659 RepID=A0A0R2LD94_9LACO|nr:hypothetical protein [Ligilactobacillus pobuzihii]KRK11039.1 hypothetical protein FD11_GL001310 [Ligilactobacillus pobuzihii E100301 = KCTC 13174]KRN99584.1 hypothetical protein IV66_GL001589 [Ligilactobacillus pobuzihii]GEN48319.1 hypothetical protein LPO01_11110 [Ligilactobacillus pobuzihii]
MEILWGNPILTIIALITVITVNFLYSKNVPTRIVNGGNKKNAFMVFLISFLSCVCIAIFLGLNTGKNGTPIFGFTFAFELLLIGLIYYFVLFNNAKKEILRDKSSKNMILKKYFEDNAFLGYTTAHYMLGVIMLFVSCGNTIFRSSLDFLPHNPIGGITELAVVILYTFVLPPYIILKTPKLFKNALNKV